MLIDEAVASGARKAQACALLGLTVRTVQRWLRDGELKVDGRANAVRPAPTNKLSDEERQRVIDTLNSPRFASRPPSQVVPTLADEGRYLAAEATMYRILREQGQQHHRGRSAKPTRSEPARHCARGPNEVWTWDITWLSGPVRGMFFYLYLILDVFSRKIVGYEVYASESSDHAAELVHRAVLAEQVVGKPLVLHADNGSPMKGASLQELLHSLGVARSHSRPHVSDDNAYVESLFRTCKYRPNYPTGGFANLWQARRWVMGFVTWYNDVHKHSGLNFVTPSQRHAGADAALRANRVAVYEAAKAKHPQRWSGPTRNWDAPHEVWLNPSKPAEELESVA